MASSVLSVSSDSEEESESEEECESENESELEEESVSEEETGAEDVQASVVRKPWLPTEQTLGRELVSMRSEGVDCDAWLECGSERVAVHSLVLRARSPVMKRMLADDQTVRVDERFASVFERMWRHMYDDDSNRTGFDTLLALELADYFALEFWKVGLELHLLTEEPLEGSRLLKLFRTADRFSAAMLLSGCLKAARVKRVATTAAKAVEWREFMEAQPDMADYIVKTLADAEHPVFKKRKL